MPDVKQAIFMIKEAWGKVSKETIANCWKHAGKKAIRNYLYIFFN
jgi:hypothetical protein